MDDDIDFDDLLGEERAGTFPFTQANLQPQLEAASDVIQRP